VSTLAPAAPPTTTNRRATAQEVEVLWLEYRRTGDRALRDRIVLTFSPLVKYIVFKKVREMPAHCDVEDFVSCGLEALIHCIDRFDPARGTTLEQYAWTRIHGAVLDELRRLDWAPRSVRRWERDVQKAVQTFTALHNRKPTTFELADALGVDERQLRRRLDKIAASDLTSLNQTILGEDHAEIERIDTIADEDELNDPMHAATVQDGKARFRAAFATLPAREREVIVLLYVKGLTLAEVGEVLGVTESRVCQIHGAVKRKLRGKLEADAELLATVA
jgi:RNA polymerase sigma factor for flagellar operon FliA